MASCPVWFYTKACAPQRHCAQDRKEAVPGVQAAQQPADFLQVLSWGCDASAEHVHGTRLALPPPGNRRCANMPGSVPRWALNTAGEPGYMFTQEMDRGEAHREQAGPSSWTTLVRGAVTRYMSRGCQTWRARKGMCRKLPGETAERAGCSASQDGYPWEGNAFSAQGSRQASPGWTLFQAPRSKHLVCGDLLQACQLHGPAMGGQLGCRQDERWVGTGWHSLICTALLARSAGRNAVLQAAGRRTVMAAHGPARRTSA